MEITFYGKRALVTGGANGIGRTIANRLVACGAKVFVLDKSKADLTSLKEYLPEVETVHADLRNFREAGEKIRQCLPIDLLVNNAGIVLRKSMLKIQPEQIDSVFDINYKACFLTAQIILRDLTERKSEGAIVNISSCHGSIVERNFLTYSNSKAALQNMTKSLALECGRHKIRVNCVSPYGVDSALTRSMGADLNDPDMVELFKNNVPLRSILTKDDIADSVLFLLSDKARMITGVDLPVDGGYAIAGNSKL